MHGQRTKALCLWPDYIGWRHKKQIVGSILQNLLTQTNILTKRIRPAINIRDCEHSNDVMFLSQKFVYFHCKLALTDHSDFYSPIHDLSINISTTAQHNKFTHKLIIG